MRPTPTNAPTPRRPTLPASRATAAAALALAALSATAGPARAGAWTQPAGHYYARVAFAGIDSRSRFDDRGTLVAYRMPGTGERETRYEGRELRGYGEYGVSDRLTAYGSTSYKSIATEELAVRRTTAGFADLYLGGRYRLSRGGIPLSVAVEAKIPTAYSATDDPSLGAGKADLTARGLVGASWGRLYGTADGGYTWRGGGYRNQVVGSLEAGGRLFGMYGGRAVLRWQRSVGSARAPVPMGSLASFDPALQSPRLVTIDGAVNVEILPGLELEAALSHTLSGRNALAGNTLEVALVGFGPFGGRR